MAQHAINVAIGFIPQPVAPDGTMRAVAMSNILASKYGARVASVSLTGVVSATALQSLALIEFQKRVCDANKLSMSFSFRVWLRPNRPILNVEKNRIGKITTVTLTMPPLKECTTSVGVHAVRTSFTTSQGLKFQTIIGGEGSPLSYNAVFEPVDPITKKATFNPQMGVTLQAAKNTQPAAKKPSEQANGKVANDKK